MDFSDSRIIGGLIGLATTLVAIIGHYIVNVRLKKAEGPRIIEPTPEERDRYGKCAKR